MCVCIYFPTCLISWQHCVNIKYLYLGFLIGFVFLPYFLKVVGETELKTVVDYNGLNVFKSFFLKHELDFPWKLYLNEIAFGVLQH